MKKNRLSHTRVLLIVILVSLDLLGLTYASWSDDVSIINDISTGNMDIKYEAIVNNAVNKDTSTIGKIINNSTFPVKLEGENNMKIPNYPKCYIVYPSEIDGNGGVGFVELYVDIDAESLEINQGEVLEDETTNHNLSIPSPKYVQANLCN